MKFGTVLGQLLAESGLSYDKLGKSLDPIVSRNYISKLVNSETKPPNQKRLNQIIKALSKHIKITNNQLFDYYNLAGIEKYPEATALFKFTNILKSKCECNNIRSLQFE
tara:strand:+ start:508 stop:834 length:327 start_codon:yes stop_codon:yes gene_type:complete